MNKKLLVFLLGMFVLVACDNDDPEPQPQPQPSNPPQAAFTVATENLVATFTNTSTDATSFQWDFGDGNTSTEQNPMHTYAEGGTHTVKLTATNANGSSEATQEVSVMEPYKTSGFLIGSQVQSSAGVSYFGGYFEELPSGDIDMTQTTAYQRFQFRAQRNGFLYGYPTSNEPGLTKFAVDAQTNELVVIDEIPLFDFIGSVVIINDELGYFSLTASQELNTFNPTTMELTGTVDMSNAQTFPENDVNGYNTMIYNEQTGKLYLSLFTNNNATGQFYDAADTYVEVVDAATQTWEKTIVHPNATYALFRGNSETVIDEEGNTYLVAQGSYGLDNNIGPNAPKGSRPQILKINTASEFDTAYAFNPINSVGLEANFFQLLVTMVYYDNGIAYGIGTAGPESVAIVELLIKLGLGTITQAEFDQLVSLVLFDESMRVIEIDLNNRSARFVDGMPFTAGFTSPFMYNYNGRIFSQMTANGATFNGFYEIDPNTNTGSPAFNISAGGFGFQLIDLSASFE
ncbi:MAG: PKD domain-containing protein [Bacteroidota bacterium]